MNTVSVQYHEIDSSCVSVNLDEKCRVNPGIMQCEVHFSKQQQQQHLLQYHDSIQQCQYTLPLFEQTTAS